MEKKIQPTSTKELYETIPMCSGWKVAPESKE